MLSLLGYYLFGLLFANFSAHFSMNVWFSVFFHSFMDAEEESIFHSFESSRTV